MPIQPPRRIFRSSTLQPSGRALGGGFGRTVAAGLFGALGGAALVLLATPADLFGRVPSPSGTLMAEPPQVAVVDGSTLRLQETVVRLQGVVTPARGQSCAAAGGAGYDCGAAATEALAALVRDHPVACRLSGRDLAGFPLGLCDAAGTDINRALVAGGWARAVADGPSFGNEEAQARAQRRGFWRDGASPTF